MLKADFACPSSLDEALKIFATTKGARAIAGGTDLLIQMRRGAPPPELLVSLHAVPELHRIEVRDGALHLGAGVRLSQMERDAAVREAAPLLSEVASQMASPHVRSRATIGGNLCNASPAADLVPPLLVHEAEVVLAGTAGRRTLSVADFLLGPGSNALELGEIVVEVVAPTLPAGMGGAYTKHQVGRCADLSIVSVAAAIRLDGGGNCTEARLALGAVAPTAIRLPVVEEALIGAHVDDGTLQRAGARASELCSPIDDIRCSCDHRCHLVGVLVPQTIREAAARAGK